MSEYEEEAEASPAQSGWMTRFASRARRSRVGQAMAGLTALLGIGVGVPKVSEVVTQQMEYQEQAEALRGEMHDLAVQPMYESAFEHATPDDDAPLMQGETKTFGEARAELNQAYTVAVHNRAPFFETFSELCAVPGTDGETLDAWKCHLLYGDQFSLNDNHKVNEQAKAVLGYVSGIDEGTTELVRDVIMHQSSIDWGGGGSSKAEPTTLLSHGSAMGAGSIGPIFFTSLGQVHPAFYGEQTDFFNERLAESIDLALGVVQNEDLAHKPAAEQKKAVSAMQDALAAQTDLELQWMNVVGETTSDQSVLFDSLTVGLPDASAPGGMSTPGLERLERREAHAEVAWKKLAALYPDDQALQQTVDNVVSNIEHRDLEFYRMASERSGLIGTHADFWQAEYAARQHAPKAVDGTLAQE